MQKANTEQPTACRYMILTPTPLHNGGMWCAENYPCKTHGKWRDNQGTWTTTSTPPELCSHGISAVLCSRIHEPTSAETPPTSPQRELPAWEERLKRIKSVVQKKLDDTTQAIYTEFPPRFVAGGGDINKRTPQKEEKLKLEMAIYKDVLDLLDAKQHD